MLVAGQGSIKKNGLYEKIQGIADVQLWDVQPNPTLSKVKEGIALAKQHTVDAILAVGGGSVIDTAKAIAVGMYTEEVWEYFTKTKPIQQALPLYVILTLSATGSEMNGNAVITNEETKQKWAIRSPLLYPKVTAIDPEVQKHLPWKQTACGAIDTLSHCMEHYFTFTDQELSIKINESIMSTVLESMHVLRQDEQNMLAREQLTWCATMALNGMSGIGTTGDWASHALEHAISAQYPHIAHAYGLSIMFPYWILHTSKHNHARYAQWAKKVWKKQSVEEGVQAMQHLFATWQAPVRLRQIQIPKDAIPALVQTVMQLGPIGKVQVLTKKDITQIFENAW